MYPFVLFGVVALVVFVILMTANPGNASLHAGVSVFVGIIITYFILYQRMVDGPKKKHNDDDDWFWIFSNKY